MSYADRTRRPPRTLTDREVKKLLNVTGAHKLGFRDHVIISLALGCGLRESEIVGLNVADVTRDGRAPVRVIQLPIFKGKSRPDANPRDHTVHVPDATFYKLELYLRSSRAPYFLEAEEGRGRGVWGYEGLGPEAAPLFLSRKGNRLSTRQVREMFATWQARAGLDVRYRFHELRHTAITAVRRRTKDIRIASRFARHANIATTVRYDHASDEEIAAAVKGLVA